jgi:Cu+-exporting ATPase
LNLYTYASQSRASAPASGTFVQTVILVEGMTCLTCELTIETSLKRVPGVQNADARVAEQHVYVSYDPTQVSMEELVSRINKTGYNATLPTSDSRWP